MSREVLSELEVEDVLARLLHGHGQRDVQLLGPEGDVGSHLFVDQDAGTGKGAVSGCRQETLEDEHLGVAQPLLILG